MSRNSKIRRTRGVFDLIPCLKRVSFARQAVRELGVGTLFHECDPICLAIFYSEGQTVCSLFSQLLYNVLHQHLCFDSTIIPFNTIIPFKIFWIHDGFLDSQWISWFTMDSWIHHRFLDSRWIPGFTMDSWIHDGFLRLGICSRLFLFSSL